MSQFIIDEQARQIKALEITLRDQFAMAALTGLLSNSQPLSAGQTYHELAYARADKMIVERAKRGNLASDEQSELARECDKLRERVFHIETLFSGAVKDLAEMARDREAWSSKAKKMEADRDKLIGVEGSSCALMAQRDDARRFLKIYINAQRTGHSVPRNIEVQAEDEVEDEE